MCATILRPFLPVAIATLPLLAGLAEAAPLRPLVIAGELVIDVHADDIPATHGQSVSVWRNDGDPAIGNFVSSRRNSVRYAQGIQGSNAVLFDGLDFLRSEGDVPAAVHGANTWSLETWILNPVIQIGVEEIYFQWGRRGGPNGTSASAIYAEQADDLRSEFAAVGHWGSGTDMSWGIDGVRDASRTPPAGLWHHVVITYDGRVEHIYVDGDPTPVNSEAKLLDINDGHDPLSFSIGSAIYGGSSGGGSTLFVGPQPLAFSGYIAALRMHTGVLGPSDVEANYAAGISAQVPEPSTAVLAAALIAMIGLRSWSGRPTRMAN